MRYAIVIENAGPNFSAYVPDLPGCVATGATLEEVEREIREARVSPGWIARGRFTHSPTFERRSLR